MESVWHKGLPRVRFSELAGKKNTDILIIGGGIAGILCAYKLKCCGADFILAEADEICSGITKNTTAKITLAFLCGLTVSVVQKFMPRFSASAIHSSP